MNASRITRLTDALNCSTYTAGTTHGFYLYPARFSPQIARTVIQLFSRGDDWVLDPFMGGGTSIVEGMLCGRRMVGIDLNSLAHFVATVRTRPLTRNEKADVREWADRDSHDEQSTQSGQRVVNLPPAIERFFAHAISKIERTSTLR